MPVMVVSRSRPSPVTQPCELMTTGMYSPEAVPSCDDATSPRQCMTRALAAATYRPGSDCGDTSPRKNALMEGAQPHG